MGPTPGTIDGPAGQPTQGDDDVFENNDSLDQASDLGTLTASRTVSGLVMNDPADWFKFTMTGSGSTSCGVGLSFRNTQGDIDLVVYVVPATWSAAPLAWPTGNGFHSTVRTPAPTISAYTAILRPRTRLTR